MQQAHAREESYRGLTRVTALAIGLGVLAMASYSLQADDWPSGLSTFAVALTFAAAAAAVGCLVGFLFGIPRTLTDNPPRDPAGRVLPPSRDDDGDSPTEYRPNTNLEQISDWLTKILVGVGLVQIGTVFPRLQRLGDFIAPSMTGPASASRVFAAVLLVYFAIAGALLSYLWTVLLLPGALRRADTWARELKQVRSEQERTSGELNQLRDQLAEQERRDAEALRLVYAHLNPSSDATPPTEADIRALKDATKAASPSKKVEIFGLAQRLRSENWRTDKSRMARTVPIFEALAEADTGNRFHRNRGQLGYALADSSPPQCERAVEELSAAIEIRERTEPGTYPFYEFVRALCLMRLDPQAAAGGPSGDELKARILADLGRAVRGAGVRQIIETDAEVTAWLARNQVAIGDLRSATVPVGGRP